MNEIFILLGLQSWKPIVTALVLSPLPLLMLMLVGARMMYWRRGVAWLVMLLACATLYLCTTSGFGQWLERTLVPPGPPLGPERIAELKRAPAGKAAIVVLGGGREAFSPEYGVSNLSPRSLARLHYGLWLSKQANLPVMYSGGIGLSEGPGISEAETAGRIAERDYGRPLKWLETESRDTRDNATRSVALLKASGVAEVVIVTDGWHMKRSLRAFDQAAQRAEVSLRLVPAPMALASSSERALLQWLPSIHGYAKVHNVLREWAGLMFGA